MFHEGTLSKLTVPILNIFLDHHHLTYNKRMTKKERLQVIIAWLTNSEIEDLSQNIDHEDDENQNNGMENDSVKELCTSSEPESEDEDVVL